METLKQIYFNIINESDTKLKQLAKSMYFNAVKIPDARKRFEEDIEKLPVVDKRPAGYYCTECGKISNKGQMLWGEKVIYHYTEKGFGAKPSAIWIVKDHYDGCRGWD